MARKFLYVVAVLIVLVIAGAAALRLFPDRLTAIAFVPTAEFAPQPELAAGAYDNADMWFARPGKDRDPSRWTPAGVAGDSGAAGAAVFFVHPTSYLAKAQWNGPLDDAESRDRAVLFVRAMASPFNASAEIWAPRYRQAAFGAFLTDAPEATRALDLAYGDVLKAFDAFLAAVPADRPIVLAGHSQGAFHLRRLVRDRVAGKPLAQRVVAVYAIGWPVSLEHDLPAMAMPACTDPAQTGCVLSWLSYAEPADNRMLVEGYGRRAALDGRSPAGSPFLCTNPLTGKAGGAAPATANAGGLVPDAKLEGGTLKPGLAPARCGADGFLYIGEGPEMGPFVLPGNNYHVYDIPLFWTNVRADFVRRAAAWKP